MRTFLAILNRLCLLFSLILLLLGVGIATIDAARSIGSSMFELTSLHDWLVELPFDGGWFVSDEASDDLSSELMASFLTLPAVAVFMVLALIVYLLSYAFKRS